MHRASKIQQRDMSNDDSHLANESFQVEAETAETGYHLHQHDGLLIELQLN